MTHKSRIFFKVHVLKCWMASLKAEGVGWPLLKAEGFPCNLDVLYGGLGIGKL